MTFTFGSLFSGIGGLDLGLERAGMHCIWQSENDEYCSKILAKHWPNIPNYGDINAIDWTAIETPDLICGGYPCQPFSYAGTRSGADDPRHLWPRFADAIRILRPRYALLENVTGHLSLGFGQVLADLASLGYDAEWDCIPAAAVGAPHRRDRMFVIAYSSNSDARHPKQPIMATTRRTTKPRKLDCEGRPHHYWSHSEPGLGRVADGIPNQLDRLGALGNAVVPQVAEHVGRMILDTLTDD
jgi:DNA (cytosine-5)-methyltransferase 1